MAHTEEWYMRRGYLVQDVYWTDAHGEDIFNVLMDDLGSIVINPSFSELVNDTAAWIKEFQ